MDEAVNNPPFTTSPWPFPAKVGLVVLRLVIGWHFLFEGLVKLADPNWSSAGYLRNSQWLLADVFHRIANDPTLLRVVDLLNEWGLTFIGLGLLLGCFTRLAGLAGAMLLGLYYVANPPFLAGHNGIRLEGSYLFLDKNLVECAALLVLACIPTGKFMGLDGLWRLLRKKGTEAPKSVYDSVLQPDTTRRELLGHLAMVPVLGGFVYAFHKKRGWDSFEVKNLIEWKREPQADATTGATLKSFHYTTLDKLEGTVPTSRIKDLEVSRMILGGNLIGGWAHARDLIYVDNLVKAYHTDEKVFQTFHMAEVCGINTILTNPVLCRVICDYWQKEGGKIHFISDCGGEKGLIEGAKKSIDAGAHACYAHGGMTDSFVREGQFDVLVEFLDLVRQNGLPVGIGGHQLETVQGCVERGLIPDFWVKTLHHTNYWSAKPQPEQDNIWCVNPEETIAYMEQRPEPWIAFKTLAAGAIPPQEGFPYAFKNGADFIVVGMYDFQLVDNVNLFCKVWNERGERTRPWYA